MIHKLALRCRSVSFRAGLITATFVGLVTGLFLFTFFWVANISTTVDGDRSVREAMQAIEQGEELTELWQDIPDDGTVVFVVLDSVGEIVVQRGSAPPSVMAELSREEFRVSDSNIEVGVVGVGAHEWTISNGDVADPEGNNYLVAAGFAPNPTSALILVIPAIWTLAVAVPAGAVASWLVRRSLRRVDQIQTEVQQISSTSLGRRLPTREIADPIDRLAHTMNEMLSRLDAAHRQQSQFVADASHELRSPVAGLLAQLEVARQYPAQVDIDELLPRLHTETIRTQALIEDLLFLSRLEGDAELQESGFSLQEAVGAIERQVDRIAGEHLELTISIDRSRLALETGDGDAKLLASEPRITRVIQNLLDNASRHAQKSIQVTLWMDPLSNRQREFYISVHDDGVGIPTEDRSRVFDRFARLDEARDRDGGGSGLGLAITQQLVSRMGGTIAVADSAIPSLPGAHFYVRLPLQASHHGALSSAR